MSESKHESDSDEDVDASEEPVKLSDETYGITAAMIQKHKELLRDRLADTKFGILDKLLANDGLTNQETTAIEECSTDPYVRSKTLMDVVLRKNIISEFIRALEDTHQKHLINYLRGDGVRSAEFGDEWPLGEDHIKRLNVNQGHLIDIIDPCFGLTDLLFSEQVINERQLRFISEEMNRTSKNKALLNIIRRKSVKDYNCTVECLIKSGQAHIANVLKDKGVIQRIRVSQGDSQTANQTEDELSDRFKDILMNRPNEEAQRILEKTHMKLFAAKKGKSIYLYIYCATLEELIELHNILVTGAVKEIVEELFNALATRQERIVVSCTYSEEEYDTCKSYFEERISTNSESMSAPKEKIDTPSSNVRIEAKQKPISKVVQMDMQVVENFDTFCEHILPRPDHTKRLLFCGSLYEMPLEYAIMNLTDGDHMYYDCNLIAAKETATIPARFHGEILTLETKDCHLGFAKLFRRRQKTTQCYIWSRQLLHGPAIRKIVMTPSENSDVFSASLRYTPHLQVFKDLSIDNAFSVLCPHWPSEADEWIIRERRHGWPPRYLIENIVGRGCHLVPKSHESNPSDETSWRFSFSQAELILLNSWNEVQKYIYHILRILKSDVVAKCNDERETETFLCTYHFKTLMLWACEEKTSSFWSEDRIEESIKELLLQMSQWLIDKNCPNYFIRDNNMLDYLPFDFDVTVEVRHILDEVNEGVSNVIALQPMIYHGKTLHVCVSNKALLLLQLGINRRYFVNALDRNCGRYVVHNFSSSELLRHEVEHLFRALELQRLLMSDLSSGEAEIKEGRNDYEAEAIGYFQIGQNWRDSNSHTDAYISSVDSISSTVHNLLYGEPGKNSQLKPCDRGADTIIGQLTKDAVETFFRTVVSALDDSHHNPSFFINAAYYANFYYTGLREYRQALKICEEALECFEKLTCKCVRGLNRFEDGYSNEILCIFINRQYVSIYDAGFQAVFGFLTLCAILIEQNEKDASVQNVLLRDPVFQICPVEFMKYIQLRCMNKLHLIEKMPLETAEELFPITNDRDTIDHKKLSNVILSAAIRVDLSVL